MSPVFLFVLLAVLLLNLAPRVVRRRSKARPALADARLDSVRFAEGLLHALVTAGGRFRGDTRIVPFHTLPTIERSGPVGRLILLPMLKEDTELSLRAIRDLAKEKRLAAASPTVMVIGGDAVLSDEILQAASPLRALHIEESGAVRESRARLRSPAPRLAVEIALDQMARAIELGGLPYLDFETARALASEGAPSRLAPIAARMPVTLALTLAIAACFGVQVLASFDSLRGDGASLAIVYRMGGIYRQAIFDGEWQRLIAAPFLHFGLVHILMNGWAQWALGGVVEALLGPWRFLILWVGSALGASLTSLAFNDTTVAAGASGAVFGLLGAFAAFVFFRKDMLPQPVPAGLRKGVWLTLLLNAFISFVPGVDMAAHTGGFLTGLLLSMFVAPAANTRDDSRQGALLPAFVVALIVFLGVGKTSIDENLSQVTRAPRIQGQYRVEEVALPIPRGFVVSKSGSSQLTTVAAETPASPFAVFYRITPQQRSSKSAKQRIEEMKPPNGQPPPQDEDDVIALAWRGTLNLRGIEVLVQTPRSCRQEAERLGSDLTSGIR